MNGTVWPVWVFVEATSPGGFLGSYGCSPPSTDDLYWYSKVAGFSHFGFFEPLLQTHGLTCGPARTGPPPAWLTIVALAVRRLPRTRAVAFTTLRPTRSPLTTPSKRPLARRAKLRVTLRLPTVTRTRFAFVPRGRRMATSASPPEIRSARFETTCTASLPAASPVRGARSATTATAMAGNVLRIAPGRIASPLSARVYPLGRSCQTPTCPTRAARASTAVRPADRPRREASRGRPPPPRRGRSGGCGFPAPARPCATDPAAASRTGRSRPGRPGSEPRRNQARRCGSERAPSPSAAAAAGAGTRGRA